MGGNETMVRSEDQTPTEFNNTVAACNMGLVPCNWCKQRTQLDWHHIAENTHRGAERWSEALSSVINK